MRRSKDEMDIVLLGGITAGLFYLIGAFIAGGFNAGRWDEWAKVALVFLWILSWALLSAMKFSDRL